MDTVNTGIPVNERVSINVLVEHNNIEFNSMYRLYSMLLIVKYLRFFKLLADQDINVGKGRGP